MFYNLKLFKQTVLFAVFVLLFFSCEKKESQQEITVSAAANFTNVLKKCAAQYEAENKNTKISLNFAATGVLSSQIVAGAPADIFFSATEKHIDNIIEKGYAIPETKRIFASNEIVFITPKNSTLSISSPEELAKDELKNIALGNSETVAAGIAAKESLVFYGVYEKIKEKAVYGETVRQVLDYVRKGEADGGIVFYTDFLIAQNELNLKFKFDKNSHKLINYPAVVIKNSKKRVQSEDFINFVTSEKGKKIFSEFGYIVK